MLHCVLLAASKTSKYRSEVLSSVDTETFAVVAFVSKNTRRFHAHITKSCIVTVLMDETSVAAAFVNKNICCSRMHTFLLHTTVAQLIYYTIFVIFLRRIYYLSTFLINVKFVC
jgi:hypothetical protein